MSTPVVYGGIGIRGNGLGTLGLGGPQPVQSFALSTLAKTAQPYIAHLYDHNMVFKSLLGTSQIINKPGLKLTTNGGYQPITLEVSKPVSGIVLGDVIRLTEQGDSTGTWLFSGNVETTPEELAPGGTHHLITVTPWVAELGDAYFNQTYAAATDVAQFVRDAVAGTAHCSVSPISCPNTGIKAIYDFQNTTALDAIHVAKQVAGASYFWFVDEQGIVYFQPMATGNAATVTLKKGVDYNSSKPVSSLLGMRNKVVAIGGSNPGDPGRIKATYDGTANQATYGVRSFNPTLSFPTVTDQPTLNAIVASLGAQFDRLQHTVELEIPAFGTRLLPGRPGGLTIRLFEPSVDSLGQSSSGTGTYSSTYCLQDNEIGNAGQRIIIGDIPFSDIDTAYEATRIAQRTATISAVAVPQPVPVPPNPIVQPPPAPPPNQVTVLYNFTVPAWGLLGAGGGVQDLGTVTFTTPRSGTCQIIGQLDCRMDAWDNYVSAPRRDIWAEITTIVVNGHQELPFGITRATYASNSASGIAIAAGTYTARWRIDTEGGNNARIYGGWGQVIWIG